MLRKSLDVYKKKIDENHHILFSYNIAVNRLDFLVDRNILEFFDEINELIRSISLEINLKVNDEFFVGFSQSFYQKFDSILYIKKYNYNRDECDLLRVFTELLDLEKTSYKEIEDIANKHSFKAYILNEDVGILITYIKTEYSILDLRYI